MPDRNHSAEKRRVAAMMKELRVLFLICLVVLAGVMLYVLWVMPDWGAGDTGGLSATPLALTERAPEILYLGLIAVMVVLAAGFVTFAGWGRALRGSEDRRTAPSQSDTPDIAADGTPAGAEELMVLSPGAAREKGGAYQVSLQWKRVMYCEGNKWFRIEAEPTQEGWEVYFDAVNRFSGKDPERNVGTLGRPATAAEKQRIEARVRRAFAKMNQPLLPLDA